MFPVHKNLNSSQSTLVLLFLMMSFSAFSQLPGEATPTGLGGSNTIYGTVITPGGPPMGTRVNVKLVTELRGDRVAVTNDRGVFAFTQVPSGMYTIVIDKEEHYESFTQYVEVIQLPGSPGGTYPVSIRLKLKPSAMANPAVLDAGFAGVPKEALDLYEKAAAAAKAGDQKTSIGMLERAIELHRDFYVAHNELGTQYLKTGDLIKAEAAFGRALKIQPGAATPRLQRGMILVELKRYEEGEPLLRKSVELDPKSFVAHYYLGMALANLGKFEEAEKELNTALASNTPQMNEGRRVLAIIYASKGKKKEAAKELEEYLMANPKAEDAEKLKEMIKQWKN